MERAVSYTADIVTGGSLRTIPDHAVEYVSDRTWARVTGGWKGRRCTTLAEIARDIPTGKSWLHKQVGAGVGDLLGRFGIGGAERRFAEELASRLPIPVVDQKLTAVSRGLQVTGIFLCFASGRDLTQCACFVDVVHVEGKEHLRKLMIGATNDWANLHHLPAIA